MTDPKNTHGTEQLDMNADETKDKIMAEETAEAVETDATDTSADAAETPEILETVQFGIDFDDDEETDAPDISDIASAAAETADSDGAAEAAEANESIDSAASASENEPSARPVDASTEMAAANAQRVNDTLALGAQSDENIVDAGIAAATTTPSSGTATRLSSHIDRELGDADEQMFVKSYPTFSLNKLTVTDRHSGRNVLDAVDLTFRSGSTHAVLVPVDDPTLHTTLVGAMTGLIQPTSGSVMNKSANIAELEPIELRGHRLGLVPQQFAVRDDMDAETNVLYAMDASNRTFLKPKPVIARELLDRVGFESATTGVKVGTLPALDRYRVAIARALSCEAEVLILDEPGASLDGDADTAVVMRLLATLAHKGDPKHCVIIITDDRTLAESADKTYEL